MNHPNIAILNCFMQLAKMTTLTYTFTNFLTQIKNKQHLQANILKLTYVMSITLATITERNKKR